MLAQSRQDRIDLVVQLFVELLPVFLGPGLEDGAFSRDLKSAVQVRINRETGVLRQPHGKGEA